MSDLKKRSELTEWKGKKDFLIIAKSFKKKSDEAICWDLKNLENMLGETRS